MARLSLHVTCIQGNPAPLEWYVDQGLCSLLVGSRHVRVLQINARKRCSILQLPDWVSRVMISLMIDTRFTNARDLPLGKALHGSPLYRMCLSFCRLTACHPQWWQGFPCCNGSTAAGRKDGLYALCPLRMDHTEKLMSFAVPTACDVIV